MSAVDDGGTAAPIAIASSLLVGLLPIERLLQSRPGFPASCYTCLGSAERNTPVNARRSNYYNLLRNSYKNVAFHSRQHINGALATECSTLESIVP